MIVQRRELLERVQARLDEKVTYRDIEKVALALEAEITGALKAGDEVSLIGFGRFVTKQWGKSSAPKHAPGTSGPAPKRMKVRAHRVARFVPGSRLRTAVRRRSG